MRKKRFREFMWPKPDYPYRIWVGMWSDTVKRAWIWSQTIHVWILVVIYHLRDLTIPLPDNLWPKKKKIKTQYISLNIVKFKWYKTFKMASSVPGTKGTAVVLFAFVVFVGIIVLMMIRKMIMACLVKIWIQDFCL